LSDANETRSSLPIVPQCSPRICSLNSTSVQHQQQQNQMECAVRSLLVWFRLLKRIFSTVENLFRTFFKVSLQPSRLLFFFASFLCFFLVLQRELGFSPLFSSTHTSSVFLACVFFLLNEVTVSFLFVFLFPIFIFLTESRSRTSSFFSVSFLL
jgi:hypothetical protein